MGEETGRYRVLVVSFEPQVQILLYWLHALYLITKTPGWYRAPQMLPCQCCFLFLTYVSFSEIKDKFQMVVFYLNLYFLKRKEIIHLFSFFLIYITRTIYCVLHLLMCSISVKTRYYTEETTTTTKKTDRGFADLGLPLILLHTSYIKKRKSHSLLLLKNKTAGITLNSNYIISLQ